MTYARILAPGQSCRVHIVDVASGRIDLVHESSATLFEAPNWTRDGDLILNGDGVLWSLPAQPGAEPLRVPIDGVPELNNDHVLAPDGRTIYLSANDWHIYSAPLGGGTARRVTRERGGRMHFLHGVSPDGARLAYVGLQPDGEDWWSEAHIYTTDLDGDTDIQLTTDGPSDGCEYSPDGTWIYYNSEGFSERPGHAQIARIPAAGGTPQQLTFDERVNWFPHLSPDGTTAVYLSYPEGTTGHPADLAVELRLVRNDGWQRPETVVRLHGGQGTINVNSWSPDGRRFAYVDYPTA